MALNVKVELHDGTELTLSTERNDRRRAVRRCIVRNLSAGAGKLKIGTPGFGRPAA